MYGEEEGKFLLYDVFFSTGFVSPKFVSWPPKILTCGKCLYFSEHWDSFKNLFWQEKNETVKGDI